MNWTLTRFAYLPEATLGRLDRPEGADSIYTIERPWLNNIPFVSCIPEGAYELKSHSGRRWDDAVILAEVPGRSLILIHPGNYARNVQGCIAPGMNYSLDPVMVTDSRKAFEALMNEFRSLNVADEAVYLEVASQRAMAM